MSTIKVRRTRENRTAPSGGNGERLSHAVWGNTGSAGD